MNSRCLNATSPWNREHNSRSGRISQWHREAGAGNRGQWASLARELPTVGAVKTGNDLQNASRQEGLTLAEQADRLGASEAALSGLINQGLGYPNFNDFLHHYRIDEAAAGLPGAERFHKPEPLGS